MPPPGPETGPRTVGELLLTRRGVMAIAADTDTRSERERYARAVAMEFADLGYVLSSRLQARLACCAIDRISEIRDRTIATLLAHIGGNRRHVPLFRKFPQGVPDDTTELWWSRVLVYFLQSPDQPCLYCGGINTTHVLNPCQHVVCDACWDGSNYSACPICQHHVDRTSPFFTEAPVRTPKAAVLDERKAVFTRLDLTEDLDAEARALFVSLCQRTQALSPDDRAALSLIVREYRAAVLAWTPPTIPVRENIAIVFGALLRDCPVDEVWPHAARHITTATDVLRCIAVMSGTDGSLIPEVIIKKVEGLHPDDRFWARMAHLLGAPPPGPIMRTVSIPHRVRRFKVVKLSRPLRRTLLGLLEGLDPDRLIEDMLRHRSWWVWVGEFLHPHEYAARFPNVARAFQIVRRRAPDGTPAPPFQTWAGRFERAIEAKVIDDIVRVLEERPGELARRVDQALRIAGEAAGEAQDQAVDEAQDQAPRDAVNQDGAALAIDRVTRAFSEAVPRMATPVLVTLRGHFPARGHRAPVRVYWPKGRAALGATAADKRSPLARATIDPIVRAIESELLRRFAQRPSFSHAVIDEELVTVMAPFNERTASAAAVSLPRGSRLAVPERAIIRLFLHWCQATRWRESDLDLSVACYDEHWRYVGVCSYYELKLTLPHRREVIAQSAGDLLDAPPPDGATEFVDLYRGAALDAGIRYAVMVVNNYRGEPFSQLERGFAGLMLRDTDEGDHFDPRTVHLRFNLSGENGVFMPLVLDVRDSMLHWLDVHARGHLEMNNVETSRGAIAKMCPAMMTYFASGVRPTLLDLARLHAAARCGRVFVRGKSAGESAGEARLFVRGMDESVDAFHARLVDDRPDERTATLPNADAPPLFGVLFRGDLDLPSGSDAYALFRERVTPTFAASELLR
jgi:hypothetical protein